MQIKLFLFNLATTGVIFLLLWITNYPKKLRYKQVLYPIAAFIISVLVFVLYETYFTLVHPYLLKGINAVLGLFFSTLPSDLGDLPEYAAALVVVLVFALLKLIRIIGLYIYFFFRWIKNKFSRKKGQYRDQRYVGSPTLAYKFDQDAEIVLREQWDFIYLFLERFAGLITIIILISIIGLHLVKLPLQIPLWTALGLMIILEGAWYLNGPRSRFLPGELTGVNIFGEKVGDYTGLWKEYQELWKDKVMFADQFKAVPYPEVKREDLFGVFKAGEQNSEELIVDVAGLLNQKYTLTRQTCSIMKELYRHNDIIISDPDYNQLAPVLITSFIRTVLRGNNILIIVPYSNIPGSSYSQYFMNWLEQWFVRLSKYSDVGGINFFSRFDNIHEVDRIMVSTADDLLEEKTINNPWFSNLKTVLFVDVTSVFSRSLTSASVLLNILRKRNEKIQCVVISDNREALEPSVRRNLDMKKCPETRLLKNKAPLSSILVWQLEGRDTFQGKIFAGAIQKHLGAEAPLAVLPWRDNLENIYLHCQEKVCWFEYIEELDNNKSHFHNKFNNTTVLDYQASDSIKCSTVSYLLKSQDRLILFSRDNENHLVTNLIKSNSYATKEILLHIVSPPYLLREYLVENIKYFYKTPIFALTSKMMVSKYTLALTLMERLILIGLSEDDILEDIRRIKPAAKDARKELRDLFILAFELDLAKYTFLSIKTHHVFKENQFEEQHIFRLSPEIKKSVKALDWLKKIKITDGYNKLGEIYLDHLHQNYLPGQIHAFSDKPYRVGNFDPYGVSLRVSHVSPVNITHYHPEIQVRLIRLQDPCLEEYRFVERFNELDIVMELCEASFDITTTGYYYEEGQSLKHKPLEGDEKKRSYTLGRILKINLKPEKTEGIEPAVVSVNLVLLLKELMVSFFPETHQYIIVCSSTADKEVIQVPGNKILFPQFTDDSQTRSTDQPGQSSNPVKLYLFEDSHQDMGLLQSIFDQWIYIFRVLDDYISWVLGGDPQEETTGTGNKEEKFEIERGQLSPEDMKPNIDRYRYLKFYKEKTPSFINLEMTSKFLRALLGDNEITMKRQHFLSREEEVIFIPDGIHQCDFCAKPLPTAEFEVLDDKRERCKNCRDTAVNYVRHDVFLSLERVYNEARQYFKKELKLQLRENITVEFATAEEISKQTGVEFEPTPRYDPRVVGFARPEKNRHIIKIENGSPHHLTLATMVHELTHIWQYDNLDRGRMEQDHGKLLVEGHAVWAELHCLEINNMAKEYREETARRKDEYGEGYQKILRLLRENETFKNPFEMLKEMYPISGSSG